MPLAAGARLGPYEILSPAGEGGMGEVYRARDTRLDRSVAIKVLPTHLSDDPDSRQRFEREARAISSLNHPNICTLHDVGHQDGVDYLVMEYVEGETLADRLRKGPLPLEQVLKYGIGICAGLEKAHRSGIIHRDLKPGNVMLTKSGVKLMDFGLAKAVSAVSPRLSDAAATMTGPPGGPPITAQGTIVGTFQYMSPEQVEGKEADACSDIFALGAVLYEMATGKRAFEGKTTASVIAAVLERDPAPVSKGQPLSPPAFDRLVGRCLAKDPEERWHTVHDIRLELLSIAQAGAAPSHRVGGRTRWLAWSVAAALALAVVFLAVRNIEPRPRPGSPVRASLLPPAKASFAPYNFTLSPDGKRLAFVAIADDGSTSLWVRSLASGSTRQVSNTADARLPFWSPDGLWVAFFAEGKLKKLEVDTGAVQTVCDARIGWGGDWNRDGIIIFAGDVAGPLSRVSATGGAPAPVTRLLRPGSAEGHRWPTFLPDGRHFLYQVDWVGAAGTYIGSLDGGEGKLLSPDLAGDVHYARGYLIFVRNGSLMAQGFDPDRLQLNGNPIPLAPQDVEAEKAFSGGNFSVSQAGALVYLSRTASLSQFEWFDRAGKELGPVGVSAAYEPRISPDGRYVAYSSDPAADGKRSIWAYDLVRTTVARLTDGDRDGFPVWSPDGQHFVYGGNRGDGFGLYLRATDGSGQDQVLEKGVFLPPADWSRDGRYILYMSIARGSPTIYAYSVGSNAPAIEVVSGAEAQFSPDGRWIAYTAFPDDIFVQPFPVEGGRRIQVSSHGGAQPKWRADGKELFYIAPDKKLMAVSVQPGKEFVPGAPRVLFQTRITGARFVYFQYDVASDGQRFLINSLRPENTAPPLTLVLDWDAELKKK